MLWYHWIPVKALQDLIDSYDPEHWAQQVVTQWCRKPTLTYPTTIDNAPLLLAYHFRDFIIPWLALNLQHTLEVQFPHTTFLWEAKPLETQLLQRCYGNTISYCEITTTSPLTLREPILVMFPGFVGTLNPPFLCYDQYVSGRITFLLFHNWHAPQHIYQILADYIFYPFNTLNLWKTHSLQPDARDKPLHHTLIE